MKHLLSLALMLVLACGSGTLQAKTIVAKDKLGDKTTIACQNTHIGNYCVDTEDRSKPGHCVYDSSKLKYCEQNCNNDYGKVCWSGKMGNGGGVAGVCSGNQCKYPYTGPTPKLWQ
ncbi:MAG: hypothetical protein WCK94_12270 [Comamonadaceae bacterium]|jgi:hypothetical protein